MNHTFRLFYCVCFVFALMGYTRAGYGFDISVYFDPISRIRVHGEQTPGWGDCPGDSDYDVWVSSVANNNEALNWWKEMGVNRLCVHYTLGDFNALAQFDSTIRVINYRWPERMYQFLEAQGYGRRAEVAQPSIYVDTTACTGSRGCSTRRALKRITGPTDPERFVLAIGPDTGREQEFFRPAVGFDTWVGWGRREFNHDWRPVFVDSGGSQGQDTTIVKGSLDNIMPLRFRLVLDYDRQVDAPTAEIAKFYWYFEDSVGRWLRYYPVTIDTTMIQHQAGQFDTLTIRIDPIDYTYTRDTVGLDSAIYSCVDPFDWDTSSHLDADYFGYYDASWTGREGRFEIRYSGWHTLYVYSVEAMDDAYYKLFEAPTATRNAWADSIEVLFRQQYNTGRCLGWYTDESIVHFVKPFVKVNEILQNANNPSPLPTFFVNGWAFKPNGTGPGDTLMQWAQDNGVNFSTYMMESYIYGPRATCQPRHSIPVPMINLMYTDTSSDVTYAEWSQSSGCTCGTGIKYEGSKNLQAAMDMEVWGEDPFLENPNWDPYGVNGIGLDYRGYYGLAMQAKLAHDYNMPLWALLCGGPDGDSTDTGECTGGQISRKRIPTPNEVKLSAWMAVACNVDGIMWYNFDFGGLLKWEDEASFCTPGGASVEQTERYSAAKEVCNDIKSVSQVLDGLTFVKTYASRAFELDYPDTTYSATAPDTLTDRHWCGDHVRAMQAIRSYEPCSYGDTACFLSNPESYPYIQVSRFRNRHVPYLDPDIEDYWFLVVNRRALSYEWRKIELDIPVNWDGPYYVRYKLADSTKLQPISTNRETDCHLQTITMVLRPGEAELIHFTRGENGCQDASAIIDSLTAIREGEDGIRLHWEEPIQTVDSLPFTPQTYYILRTFQSLSDTFDTIAFTETNTYLDTLAIPEPKAFYMVHACGTITERPGQALSVTSDKPRKEKVVSFKTRGKAK